MFLAPLSNLRALALHELAIELRLAVEQLQCRPARAVVFMCLDCQRERTELTSRSNINSPESNIGQHQISSSSKASSLNELK